MLFRFLHLSFSSQHDKLYKTETKEPLLVKLHCGPFTIIYGTHKKRKSAKKEIDAVYMCVLVSQDGEEENDSKRRDKCCPISRKLKEYPICKIWFDYFISGSLF